ncbi:kinase-like domain-containing protein [Xylaria castorea]|nr:kinase-like domain-containing protein [Xylaria castorea]
MFRKNSIVYNILLNKGNRTAVSRKHFAFQVVRQNHGYGLVIRSFSRSGTTIRSAGTGGEHIKDRRTISRDQRELSLFVGNMTFRAEFPDHERYRSINIIGIGGFGVIYRAADVLTGEVYVAKECHQTKAGRGERNLAALLELNHVNMIRYFKIYYTLFAVVIEFGGPNLEVVHESQPLHNFELRNSLWQLADVSDYIYKCGITHRDIKPSIF